MKRIKHYIIDTLIGEGTMAKVYEAHDDLTNQHVALKVLAEGQERFRERFLNEAKLLKSISHPNILRVYEVGRAGKKIFYTMELRKNVLTNYLKPSPWTKDTDGPDLSTLAKLTIMTGILSGLECLHSRGVVHRDLCPNNILLDQDDSPAISDFGISKSANAPEFPDSARGNPKLYGAPEQDAALGRASAAADVYSFGVIAFQLLSGLLPKGNPLPRLDTINREVPPELAVIIMQTLDRDPLRRPNSSQLLKAFEACLQAPSIGPVQDHSHTEIIPSYLRTFMGAGHLFTEPYDVDEVALTVKNCKSCYEFVGVACLALQVPDLNVLLRSIPSARFVICDPDSEVAMTEVATILNKSSEEIRRDVTQALETLGVLRESNPSIEFRLSPFAPPWRLVILDQRKVLLRCYKGNRFSAQSPMLVLQEGPFADGCRRYVEQLWRLLPT